MLYPTELRGRRPRGGLRVRVGRTGPRLSLQSPAFASPRRRYPFRGTRAAAILVVLLDVAGPAIACPLSPSEPVDIVEVEDARTIRSADGRTFRPAGIESFAALGDGETGEGRMIDAMQKLASGGEFRIRTIDEKPDRWGRQAALLFDTSDAFVQSRLTGIGAALAMPEATEIPCFDEIIAAESAARLRAAGGWANLSMPSATPQSLAPRIDHFAVFEGRIVSVGNRKWRTYLNFGWRWSEDVTVTIEAKDRERFGGEAALAALAGREVRVRGHLSEHGGPATVIHSPHQLELIDRNPPGDGAMP